MNCTKCNNEIESYFPNICVVCKSKFCCRCCKKCSNCKQYYCKKCQKLYSFKNTLCGTCNNNNKKCLIL